MFKSCPKVQKIILSSNDDNVKDMVNKINKTINHDIKIENSMWFLKLRE